MSGILTDFKYQKNCKHVCHEKEILMKKSTIITAVSVVAIVVMLMLVGSIKDAKAIQAEINSTPEIVWPECSKAAVKFAAVRSAGTDRVETSCRAG